MRILIYPPAGRRWTRAAVDARDGCFAVGIAVEQISADMMNARLVVWAEASGVQVEKLANHMKSNRTAVEVTAVD